LRRLPRLARALQNEPSTKSKIENRNREERESTPVMTERSENRSRIATAALFLILAVGLILGVGLTGGLITSLTGCSSVSAASEGPAPEEAPRLTTTAVSLRPVAQTDIVTGTVIADRSSAVAADAAGKVIAVYVDRGDRVTQGQPLVRLDVRGAVLGAREARAQRAAIDSEARLAEIERQRSKSLFDKGAITRAQYDREIAAHSSSSEQAEAAAARLSLANKAIGDGVVRAPFSGVVSERLIQVGEYVRADSRLLTLVDPDPLKLELTVPESLIGQIAIGRSLEFSTSALPGQRFAARIDVLGPAVDRAGRSLVIEALVDGNGAAAPDSKVGLLPGMFVTAYIENGSRELPMVPRTALRRSGATWRLYAVVDGALEERIVQLADANAPTQGELVPLESGARAGDRVVTPATDELRDGMRAN
jgi:membrane fusion protein (multidrug efflux system)